LKGGVPLRLTGIQRVSSGVKLAQPILDEKGKILLGAGVELTEYLIKRLEALGISSIYIEDEQTADILVEDVISQQTRQEALALVHDSIQKLTNEQTFSRQFQSDKIGRRIRDLFMQILSEMKEKKGLFLNLANIYSTDHFLYHHSVNVSVIAMSIGMKLGLNEKQLLELGVGTLLHDVGKLKIPDAILNKPGRLTDEEFEEMKKHTVYGYDILRTQDDISAVSAHIALQHHERLDGTGYPRGLTEKEIHPYAKITAVADVYEALTANRVYRKGHLPHDALELLLGACGSQFDTNIVQLFLKTIAIYPVGMTVKLNTGEIGVVTHVPENHPQRPTVRILQNAAGEKLASPHEINLLHHLTTMIVQCEV
jgi:putative nucleotidyltransferase with HDIG domain